MDLVTEMPKKGQFNTRCRRGHAMTGYNLVITAAGYRECRACKNIRSAKHYQRTTRGPAEERGVMTFDEIGRHLNLSGEAVRLIYNSAIKKLKERCVYIGSVEWKAQPLKTSHIAVRRSGV